MAQIDMTTETSAWGDVKDLLPISQEIASVLFTVNKRGSITSDELNEIDKLQHQMFMLIHSVDRALHAKSMANFDRTMNQLREMGAVK